MVEAALRTVAEDFWAEVGQPEPYPRDLQDSVVWTLPVAVLRIRHLTVGSAEEWLRRQAVPLAFGCRDRSLRGCLVSFGGKGLVLLDGDDPEDERRFSLAHEVAHFLLDYLLPRRRAIERLGVGIAEVLDGRRPPTARERVDALLGDTPIGTHTHLMDRSLGGTVGRAGILSVESRADRLALELLAPEAEVRRRVPDTGSPRTFGQAVDQTANVLRDAFGLPPMIAEGYGTSLCRSWYGGPSFGEWLGL
jgi:hypothetical protein